MKLWRGENDTQITKERANFHHDHDDMSPHREEVRYAREHQLCHPIDRIRSAEDELIQRRRRYTISAVIISDNSLVVQMCRFESFRYPFHVRSFVSDHDHSCRLYLVYDDHWETLYLMRYSKKNTDHRERQGNNWSQKPDRKKFNFGGSSKGHLCTRTIARMPQNAHSTDRPDSFLQVRKDKTSWKHTGQMWRVVENREKKVSVKKKLSGFFVGGCRQGDMSCQTDTHTLEVSSLDTYICLLTSWTHAFETLC